jgi:hypothetical protein
VPFEPYDLPWLPGAGAQEYVLDQIFSGLENDIHFFVIGKARQLGMTTLMLLLDIFWCAMYPGLQGALVVDEAANKEKLRLLLEEILERLPETHPLPIIRHNTNGIVFDHGVLGRSMLDYMVAGTRKKPGSLGRSRALNFLHGTEVAMWGDEEGLESLISSLSDEYPARLFVLESTGKGYNHFHSLYKDAELDDLTQKAIFIAWWRHPGYVAKVGSKVYERYGYKELARDEAETQRIVKEMFGYTITREQWAWYRHRKDPQRRKDIEEVNEDRAQIVEVEYPSHPEEMFRLSGSPFLPGPMLDRAMQIAAKQVFKGYYYRFGQDFTELGRQAAGTARVSQLKVWHEPRPNGRYIVAADPAYGSGPDADRYCCQVLRVYSDRLVQCAEFCTPTIEPFQFTWVLADLCGWYKNAKFILEINGPGEAVMTEFRHLQTLLDTGRLVAAAYSEQTEADLEVMGGFGEMQRARRRPPSPLVNVRNYLYHRPDAFGSQYNVHWKTSQNNKPVIMTQLGDQFLIGKLVINSVGAVDELKTLTRTGGQILADGKNKDDRAVALALGTRCWIDWERAEMDSLGATYEREEAADRAAGDADSDGYMAYIMAQRAAERAQQQRLSARMARRRNWNW